MSTFFNFIGQAKTIVRNTTLISASGQVFYSCPDGKRAQVRLLGVTSQAGGLTVVSALDLVYFNPFDSTNYAIQTYDMGISPFSGSAFIKNNKAGFSLIGSADTIILGPGMGIRSGALPQGNFYMHYEVEEFF